ncbi:MAG: NAD(+) synthase [Bacteroidia bacterium]|nr:NAD(+) synthase [Bacteroidia bacterium]
MQHREITEHIVSWLRHYCEGARTQGFVVGISGGIDSALTSTLCALTGAETLVIGMPIRQHRAEYERAKEHIHWLESRFKNVRSEEVDLSESFSSIENKFPREIQDQLTMANTRARLRMATLYAFACHYKLLVAGTGNKVEDFGVGFFTKYGDGGVDLSPIADLMKSEVRELARHLGIAVSIINAAPTDGLFADGRSDEDQIGASYDELEWAMKYIRNAEQVLDLSERQKRVLKIYSDYHNRNRHKMEPIPVCTIPDSLK